ncbi:SIMPL domain-containing protein [Tepidibacter hydrothermalis]|uniref:SIMPL domain-containing protein n=1 Tax=Tepidibacter hydrothermalis TaxID=3036126 RepID=A0ABY8E8Q5_9FIRM|nr:SIMPL domain-containing protein [Tepidibacter hydrothermalis]WFD09281.1 SIMPL domain-containing protein [Tepidibacter hydrothermalis]
MIPYVPSYTKRPTMNRNDDKKPNNDGTISVVGTGSIQVPPDMATVTVGVVTQDKDLEKAQAENSKLSNNVIKGLNDIGIEDEDIQTINYSVRTNYDYINGKQKFRNYEVRHVLQVTVKDIDQVGEVYDVAIRNGANIEGGVTFGLSNEKYYYDKALDLAVKDSVKKANNIANSLNTKVNNIPSSIKETSFGQAQVYPKTYAATNGAPPIQSGLIEVSAQVNATFEMI